MATTTLGRELLRQKLPDKYKDYADKLWDKGTVEEILTRMAKEDPDNYVDTLQELNDLGRRVVTGYGKEASLSVNDFKQSAPIIHLQQSAQKAFRSIYNNPKLSDDQKEKAIHDLNRKLYSKAQDIVYNDHQQRNTALGSQMAAGVRGNKSQLMQLALGNIAISDAAGRPVPYTFVENYSSGVSPLTYWLGANSSRKGYIDVQFATADAGYLSKQIANSTHNTPISMLDCGTTDTGIPVGATDSQNIGAILLKPYKGHKPGTIIDKKFLADADDDDEIIIRSPITCQAKGGICAHCAGIQNTGKFPAVGEYLALTAAKSFSEPLTQAAVGCLHPDTLVRMSDWSIRAIKDIKIGDKVLGSDRFGNTSPAEVTNIWDKGVVPMYNTTYRLGIKTERTVTLQSTLNHKVLQATNKTNCKDEVNNNIPRILQAGEPGRRVSAVGVMNPTGYDDAYEYHKEALFIGLMIGDGCYSKGLNGRPHFSCADKSLIDDTKEYMASLGMRFAFHKGSECYWRVVGMEEHTSKDNPARLIIEKFLHMGDYSYDKKLPEGYNRWNREAISELLSGMWITDGCISCNNGKQVPYVSYGCVSRILVEQIADCIEKWLGIPSPKIKENNTSRKRTLYSITYGKCSDVIAILEFLKLYGIKENTRKVMLARAYDALDKTGVMDVRLYKRIGQEFIGDLPALDIEVDNEDHLFVLANGLIVSNSKHAGSVGASDEDDDMPTGFQAISQMLTLPSTFKAKAVLSPVAGKVTAIKEAPQGGHYISMENLTKPVYVPQTRKITVSVGDTMSPGDVMTNGIPNPKEIVEYKGIGYGRDYFTKAFSKILKDSGAGTMRRNVEAFTRAFVNKVRVTNPDGYKGFMPGDIVDYDDIIGSWKPRSTSTVMKPQQAIGKYLEKPTLYYTVGTPITKEVADTLDKYKMTEITVDNDPPPWEPELVRSQAYMLNDKDWMARLTGERIQPALFDAVRQGLETPYEGQSMYSRVMLTPYRK